MHRFLAIGVCLILSSALAGCLGPFLPDLPAPVEVTASDGSYPDRVSLSWNEVQGADYYTVSRATWPGGDYTHVLSIKDTTCEDLNVAPYVRYWYQIRACSSASCGPGSLPESGFSAGDVQDGSWIGSRAFDFTAPTAGQEEITLSDLRGNVVLIEFWGTWCGPCMASMPWVNTLWRRYHTQGFVVLAVSTDATASEATAYLTEEGYTGLTCIWEPGGWHSPLVTLYGVDSIPRSIIVDRDGIVRYNDHPADLDAGFIETILAE